MLVASGSSYFIQWSYSPGSCNDLSFRNSERLECYTFAIVLKTEQE